jgi:hypothetical protein
MGQPSTRRCAIWITPSTLAAAQELADLAGFDVDTFIEFIVTDLHDHERREGSLRTRATDSATAPVIPIYSERRRTRQRQS